MNNGINTKALAAEQELTITINRLLKNGLPPVVLQMLLQNTANKLDVVCQQAVEDERKQAEEKGKGETNE